MLLIVLEPITILVLVCTWTWALCSVLARGEPYAWLVGILFLPPVALPLYVANRASGGLVDRQFLRIRHRARIRELALLCRENGTFDRRLELAELLFSEGHYRECLVELDEAMKLNDEDRRVQFLAARALVASGKRAAALPHAEFVVDIDPTYANGEAAILAAHLAAEAGNSERAVEILGRCSSRQQIPSVVLMLAELLSKAGRNAEAISALDHLLELAKDDQLALRSPAQRRALSQARSLRGRLKV